MQASLIHHAAPRFWDCYYKLPAPIRQLADTNFEILKLNPLHPSLHFKQINNFRSVRIGLRYRALGVSVPDGIIWFCIGNHGDYDRLIQP